MSYMLQPQIVLLRDGTDDSQGKNQIISNINACCAIGELVKSTLGPCGMDKLIQTARDYCVSNDGATVIDLLDIQHPAGRILADISKAQDNEVGDGTTSVVLIACEMLREAKVLIEDGMNPQIIAKSFKLALNYFNNEIQNLAVNLNSNAESKLEMLKKCAQTSLNSKLLNHYKEFFSDMVVTAVSKLNNPIFEKNLIGIKHATGGSVTDSMLIDGVAFRKCFSYAGFEQQPKRFKNPKILLLNVELELKTEKESAEVRIENPDEYQSIVDAEWKIIYLKLDKIVQSGAQIILSKLPIGDLATQYFADRDIFCAGRVQRDDMERVSKATNGVIQTSVNGLTDNILGKCGLFEEKQIGAERYNLFMECPESKTSTIILRGGATQFIQEAERSLNDAIMIVSRAIKSDYVVPGGGAVEMEMSKMLRNYSKTFHGKEQIPIKLFAKALEVIPKTIAENAGINSNLILNQLRKCHNNESDPNNKYFGVDVKGEGVFNTFEGYIWEPLIVKKNSINAACEVASLILLIDETVKNPEPEEKKRAKQGPMPGGRLG